MKIMLRKTLYGFAPIGPEDTEAMRRYKVGAAYIAEVRKPRNYKAHCHFMALMQLTFENQEAYTDFRMFRRAVALAAGHVDQVITLDGEVTLLPLSYSYDEVPDEAEFVPKFNEAMTVCARILGGLGLHELEAEVSRFASARYGVPA